jgi:exosome complex RNA-binding protein Csl4
VYNCYRPGDIVRAVVISLGDARSYYLSTARTDLGVVSARGRADKPMVPLSWELMQCPVTRVKEYRKVAKIDPNEQLAAPAPKSRPAAAAPKAEPQAMQDGTDE